MPNQGQVGPGRERLSRIRATEEIRPALETHQNREREGHYLASPLLLLYSSPLVPLTGLLCLEASWQRSLEYVGSLTYSPCVHAQWLICVKFFATPCTLACQAPLSMEFSRQEYWSELPFPSPTDLPVPGIKPGSPTLQADSLPSEAPGKSSEIKQKNRCRGQSAGEMCWNDE